LFYWDGLITCARNSTTLKYLVQKYLATEDAKERTEEEEEEEEEEDKTIATGKFTVKLS
jgi:hypothetical protein